MAGSRRQAILDLLSARLGQVPEGLRTELTNVADGPTLERLLLAASAAASLEEFHRALRNPNA